MNVTSVASAVFVDLRFTAEQLEHQRLLDVVHAEDGRSDAPGQQVVNAAVAGDVSDLVLFLFGDDDLLERDVLPLKGVNTQKDVKHRRVLAAFSLRTNEQHPVGFDTIARVQAACKVLFADAEDSFGLDAAFHLLRQFLQLDEL